VQNSGQDATTQFEDINHSEKAYRLMNDFYIGDYVNPHDPHGNEGWDEFLARKKQQEKEGESQSNMLLILVVLVAAGLMYWLNFA